MSAKIGVAVMAVLLLLFIVLAGWWAVLMIGSGETIGIVMGVSLVVLSIVAAWALWREVAFGAAASALGARLEAEGGLPQEQITLRESGRPVREEADALFPRYRADVEEHPDDWRAWYRLGLAYDGAGDRSRARQAVRKAIALERASRR